MKSVPRCVEGLRLGCAAQKVRASIELTRLPNSPSRAGTPVFMVSPAFPGVSLLQFAKMGNCLGLSRSALREHAASPGIRRKFSEFRCMAPGLPISAVAQGAQCCSLPLISTHSCIFPVSNNILLLALFEGAGGHGGHLIASFCNSLVVDAFTQASKNHKDKLEDTLQATLQILNAAALARKELKAPECAHGASATLIALDLDGGRCIVANVGHVRCALAQVSGSFNARRPQFQFLSSLHTMENAAERARTARQPSVNLPVYSVIHKNEYVLTRALGGSSDPLKIDVHSHLLSRANGPGHIVLASSGFWDIVGSSAVAVRTEIYTQVGCADQHYHGIVKQ